MDFRQINQSSIKRYISSFRPKIIEISNNTVLVLQEICGAMIGAILGAFQLRSLSFWSVLGAAEVALPKGGLLGYNEALSSGEPKPIIFNVGNIGNYWLRVTI